MTSGAPTLRDRQRRQVRSDIDRAALRLFAERGFDDVTTEEIAVAAGISHSTYFRHVTSKEDLLLRPVRLAGAAIVQNMRERPASESPATAVSEAILARSDAFAADRDSVAHWRAAILGVPHLLDRVALVDRGDRDQLVELVRERMTSRRQDDAHLAGLVVHVLLAAAEYAFTTWLLGSEDDWTVLHEATRDALEHTGRGLPG